jgi:hypothetical protein
MVATADIIGIPRVPRRVQERQPPLLLDHLPEPGKGAVMAALVAAGLVHVRRMKA